MLAGFNSENIHEYLHKGILLLEEKEFNDFHFDIDVNDSSFCEMADMLIECNEYDVTCMKNIEPKANKILKEQLTEEKIKSLHLILDEIELRNSTNTEICAAAFVSKLFLRNKDVDYYKLPLAFTRLVEDVYMTFTNNEKNKTINENGAGNHLNN